MSWSKIAVLTLLLIVMSVVTVFGGYFGYTVQGEPHGLKASTGEVTEYQIGDVPFFDYEPTIEVKDRDLLGEMISFVYNMVLFKIDNMPDIFVYVFMIMALLSVYIVISLFLPGGGS